MKEDAGVPVIPPAWRNAIVSIVLCVHFVFGRSVPVFRVLRSAECRGRVLVVGLSLPPFLSIYIPLACRMLVQDYAVKSFSIMF